RCQPRLLTNLSQPLRAGHDARRYPRSRKALRLCLQPLHFEPRLQFRRKRVPDRPIAVDLPLIRLVRIAPVGEPHPPDRNQVPEKRLAHVLAPERPIRVEDGEPTTNPAPERADPPDERGRNPSWHPLRPPPTPP